MGLFGLHLPKKVDNIIGAAEAQLNPFDNGATYNTVRQGITPAAARPVAPTIVNGQPQGGYQPPSTIRQIGNMAAGFVHPFSTFGSAIINTPDAVLREIQNKPIYDIQQKVFGTTDPGSIGRQIAGDTGILALTALAPGVGKLVDRGVTQLAPSLARPIISKVGAPVVDAAGNAVTRLNLPGRIASNTISGPALGAGFGAASVPASGQNYTKDNFIHAVKSGAEGGLAFGVGAPVVAAGVKGGARAAIRYDQAQNQAGFAKIPGVPDNPATEVGGTSFRGAPVKTIADTHPYYETPRSKGFENSLNQNASKYGLTAKVERTGGVWEGAIEPSFKATVDSNDPVAVRAYAAEHGIKGNQDAMLTFTHNAKGADTKYTFTTKNPDAFVQGLNKHGISGATVVGNKVEIVDFGNELRDNISKLGGKPIKQTGDAGLLERSEYAQALKDHAAKNGDILQPAEGPVGQAPKTQASPEVAKDPVVEAVNKENQFKAQVQALREQTGNDAEFYDKTILNNQEAPGDVGALARHIARRVEGGGEKPGDVLDEVLQPTDLKAEAAAQQSAHLQELKGMVRDLEKSTGQKGLYANVLKKMSGMNEKQQLDYLGKSLKDMRDKGVLATVAVSKDKPFPTEAEFNKMIPAVKGAKTAYGQDNTALTAAEKKSMVDNTKKGSRRNDAAINTARNPFKSLRQDVGQGDYGKIVSNEQAISRPIDTIGGQWAQAVKSLSNQEKINFWRSVEKPNAKGYSPNLQRAIALWREVDNRIHANSQALGGNTNYLHNHALHPWQLPEEYMNHIINGGNPDKFEGLNSLSRKYRTIDDAPAHMKLGTDPLGEGTRYIQASSALLRRASLKHDITLADAGELKKGHLLDLGNGHSVEVSAAGKKALRGIQKANYSDNAAIKGTRSANVALKSTLLSGGQFHPINISLLRAAPTLVMTGHPVAAAKGLYGTFRAAFGTEYAQRVIGKAITDGTVDKAAKIGMPYGGGGYDTGGSFLKGGVGHHTVFEKQMPMMHDQVVRSILRDLEKKNVSLDSEAARRAGAAGNRLMGFINKEAANLPPGVQKVMGDWLLAGQFTPSKIGQVRAAFNPESYKGGGVAGKYAAASVAANVAATTAVIVGLGYVVKQKSDDVKDMLIRALTDPAVPTPIKDSKGNTVKLRLPGTDTSDISKLLGIKPVRGPDGHLSISWSPQNMPQTLQDFARARLAPLPSDVVKVVTNTTFAGKPLYDPNASGKTKVIQGATTLTTGHLPIGVQGVAYTKPVKDRLPKSAQDVLNAGTPGSNPIIKSVGSSFGLTPSTDTTTGKGQQTAQYFDEVKKAKVGLTAADQKTFDTIFGSKKNPVTGKYDNPANVWDSGARASALLDHPKVLDAAVKMNQALAAKGQATDPLYSDKSLTTKQRQTFLAYQAQTEPATRAEMRVENPFINDLTKARSAFFDSLPPGDPNKPKDPIPYPTPSKSVSGLQDQYFALSDPADRVKFIKDNPELATQFAAVDQYNRSVRDAKNLPQYDSYPVAPADVQKNLDIYGALPKNDGPKGGSKTRSLWIKAHPQEWNAISTYLTQTSLYNLEQSAQKAAFEKQGFDQKGLKAISSLGQYDIGKTTDANGNTIYAIAPGSSRSSFSGGSGSGGYYRNSGSSGIAGSFPSGKRISPAQFIKRIPVAGGPTLPHGGAKVPRPKPGKVSAKVAIKGRKTNRPKTKTIRLA